MSMLADFRRIPALLFALIAGLAILSACSPNKPSEDLPQPLGAEVEFAQAWADSVLGTLTQAQKAAQLIWLAAPTAQDSLSQSQFAALLGQNRFGGVLVAKAQRDTLRDRVHHWKEAAPLPIWVALDAGPRWSEAQDWPSLLTLGTVADDSLAKAWGEAIGFECNYVGAQVCLISAGKVGEKGAWMHDALGVVPDLVTRMSDSLLAGISQTGIQACSRPLVSNEDFSDPSNARILDGLGELDRGKAAPLKALIKSQKGLWLQSSDAVFASIDQQPISTSARALGFFLRQKLAFEGPVLSPRGAGVASLLAGCDVLVAPANPAAAVDEIVAAVAAGQRSQAWLDSAARKQLLLKGRKELYAQSTSPSMALDPYRRLLQLDRAIARATIVVLRDKKNRLPLGADITAAKVASMAVGSAAKTDLQVTLDAYASVDHYLLGPKADSAALEKQIEKLSKYQYVILSLHSPLVSQRPDGQLSPDLVAFLKKLDRKTKLIVADFAGQASLDALDSLNCLLFVSEDRARNAFLAGQAIMGAFPVTAVLPDDISPRFLAGDGKVLKRKLRFEYSEPEELGIDPQAMLRIDSFVEHAVKVGAFPGCQVFAAKDGKVFLNRAYGYQDYEHRQRVRTNDLYDIASVSKIAATTLMAMSAFERDTLHLNQPLKYFLPELDSSFITIKDITPQELLTHSSGLPTGVILNKYFKMITAPDSIRQKIYSKKADSTHTLRIAEEIYLNPTYQDTVWNIVRKMRLGPKTYEYSDLSMYLMKAVLERVLNAQLQRYVEAEFYRPMGLRRICYHPLDRFEKEEIVPTQDDRSWRKQVLQGDVHDPTVAFLGGIGGPAGIFSNSRDLATVMQMVLDGGQYGGKQFFKPETVKLFTSRQPDSRRGLGFDMQLPVPQCDKGYCCQSADPNTFGHFGYTGTCAWADPKNKIVFVFLSNRVYPDDKNKKINGMRIRQGLQQLIYDALGLGIPKAGIMAEEQQDCYPEGA